MIAGQIPIIVNYDQMILVNNICITQHGHWNLHGHGMYQVIWCQQKSIV